MESLFSFSMFRVVFNSGWPGGLGRIIPAHIFSKSKSIINFNGKFTFQIFMNIFLFTQRLITRQFCCPTWPLNSRLSCSKQWWRWNVIHDIYVDVFKSSYPLSIKAAQRHSHASNSIDDFSFSWADTQDNIWFITPLADH